MPNPRKTESSTERQRGDRGSSPGQSQADSASTKKAAKGKPERKAHQGRAVTAKRGTRKCWHITDFRQLFELSDDLRKNRPGPLAYTKSFVTTSGASKAYEVRHVERLRLLKSRTERHLLRSVFEDLKNYAGSKTIDSRGFLLTTEGQAASYDYLAAQLNLEKGDLKQAMPILEIIRLVERISLSRIHGDKLSSRRKRKRPKSKDKSVSTNQKTGAPDSVGKKRKLSEKIGKKRTPLRNGKTKYKYKEKATATAVANGNGKNKQEIKQRQVTSQTVEAETQTKTQPPKAEPSKPKEADLGGSSPKKSFGPPGSEKRSEPQRLGEVLSDIEHRYDSAAKSFGAEVFHALALPYEPNSPEGRRELGCFASRWTQAQHAGLSPPALSELREKSLADARKLSQQRTKYRNLSAIWTDIFKKTLCQAELKKDYPGEAVATTCKGDIECPV